MTHRKVFQKLSVVFSAVIFLGVLFFFGVEQLFAQVPGESPCEGYCNNIDCTGLSDKKCDKKKKSCKKQCKKYCEVDNCVGSLSKKCEKGRKKFEKLTDSRFFPCDPLLLCVDLDPTPEQIDKAVGEALIGLENPWGNVNDFEFLVSQIEKKLYCTLKDEAQVLAWQESLSFPSSETCVKENVDYCGVGTSETSDQTLHTEATCLNEACCMHDKCYSVNCVDGDCYWTTQTQECDDALIDVCNNDCDLDVKGRIICAIAKNLNGKENPSDHPVCGESASCEKGPEPNCAGQTCCNFETCNPGSGCEVPVCGSLAEGGGLCIEGAITCTNLDTCNKSTDCKGGGLCFVGTCCERLVCVPVLAFCPDIGLDRMMEEISRDDFSSGKMTIGGIAN